MSTKYIVEVDIMGEGNWKQSGNTGLFGVTFNTLAEATAAKTAHSTKYLDMDYRVSSVTVPDQGPFVAEVKINGKWVASGNTGLVNKEFKTEALAQEAISLYGSLPRMSYRVVAGTAEESSLLDTIFNTVYKLSLVKPYITADDVQFALAAKGLTSARIGNKAGSFFKSNPNVTKTDAMVRSKRFGRHGSKISVYRSINKGTSGMDLGSFVEQYNAKGASVGK